LPIVLFAQEKAIEDFKIDFEIAANSDLTEKQLDKLVYEYELISEYKTPQFAEFRDDDLYKKNIDKILFSENQYHRILAYLLIYATNDKSKEDVLLDKIKTETEEGNLVWSGMALMSIGTNHTDELFDFLVKNEDFGDAHLLPFYIRLNKDALRNTAYKKIENNDTISKILAVQILSVTGNNAQTEKLVKKAVKEWNQDIKGFAIYTLRELQIGNLLEILTPLLNDKKTRRIALQALANSPTSKDRKYLISEVKKNSEVDEDVLDALFKSKHLDNVKLWLKIIQTKQISKDYYFLVFDQPLLMQDEILNDLHKALQNIKDKEILAKLVRALENRTDDKSVDIMINLLKHSNSSVRYWTAMALKNNTNEKLKITENMKLIESGLLDGNKRN
jgi:HEAT repeat protein